MRPHEGLTYDEIGRLLKEARDKDSIERFFSSVEADAKELVKKRAKEARKTPEKKLSEEEKKHILNLAQELRFVWDALFGYEDEPLGLAYGLFLISATYFAASHGLGKEACPQASALGVARTSGKVGGKVRGAQIKAQANKDYEAARAPIEAFWDAHPEYSKQKVADEIPVTWTKKAGPRTIINIINWMEKEGYVPPPKRKK